MQVLAQLSYEKIRQIGVGQGLNSKVYLAKDPQLGGEIAVKEIPKRLLGQSGIADIYNEAQVMFAARHPRNVVPILYAGEIPNADAICIAMPFYKNGSLQDRILAGPLPLLEVLRVGLAMLTGLAAIHTKSLFHFDLKPSNILFNDHDDPMVADFGQTRAAASGGKVALPPMYPGGLPPEFYGTKVGSIETDIYHAGLTLYRAINGDPFFQAQQPADDAERRSRTLAGTFPQRNKFFPHISGGLRRVIRKAINVDHLQRYRSVADMTNALASCSIENNWATKCNATGEYEWTCPRDGKPGLIIELAKNGKLWDVNTFTDGSSRRRMNGKCLQSASRKDAEKHLKKVFAELG